jgi:hypothetical protein
MKRTPTLITTLVLALVLALMAGLSVQLPQGAARAQEKGRDTAPQQAAAPQAPLGTSFTYQGRLTDAGGLANGEYDFQFTLQDDSWVDTPVAGPITIENHNVVEGLFTVQLDFGEVFTGTARYLEIAVRPGTSGGAFTPLTPRQELTPAPYALALPGLWTQQNLTSTNIIAGYSGNSVSPGVVGAVIGGGGNSFYPNAVLADYATIGGGTDNEIGANSQNATISGGVSNHVGNSSGYATIGGGLGNDVTDNSWYATIGGGWLNDIRNSGDATIGGGAANNIAGGSTYATIGGGYENSIGADGSCATIGGGRNNDIGIDSDHTTIGGGWDNSIGGFSDNATIGGGRGNDIGTNSQHATTAGGWNNDVGDESWYVTIGGGRDNLIYQSADDATIGGGQANVVTANHTTIAGGYENDATGYAAAVGGGHNNTASNNEATVAGGWNNQSTGQWATVPGGNLNLAQGNYSLAAGRRAKANNQGCFVWGDSWDADVSCNDANRWVVRATGGVYFYTNLILNTGSRLAAGGSSWGSVSARHLKENFAPVDTQALLARLAEHPITTWNYKAQDPSIRHIGPMAEDFNALLDDLGGEGEEYINTLDADGVALAAIQGLYAQNQELEQQVDALEQQNADLETRLTALERGGVSRSSAFGLPTWLLLGGFVLVGGVVLKRRGVGGDR